MKKSILFLCLIFTALSCSKDKITNVVAPISVDAIKISEAKQWFESTHAVDNKKQLNATSSVAQSKSLNWNQAVFENRPNEERVYVPLTYLGKKFHGQEERFRLLITTDKTGKKNEAIVHYIANYSYYKKNNHISTVDFTGLILVSDWQDNFLYGLRYEHAKIIGRVTSAASNSNGLTSSPKPNGAFHTTLNTNGGSCTAITIAYYSCSGYTCDNPVLVGMDIYYDCSGGGSTGSSGSGSSDGGPLGGGGSSGGGGATSGCGDALICPDGTTNGSTSNGDVIITVNNGGGDADNAVSNASSEYVNPKNTYTPAPAPPDVTEYNCDELRNTHPDDIIQQGIVGNINQFVNNNQGYDRDAIIGQRGYQSITPGITMSLGPTMRYIQDPLNPDVIIDLRHMLTVGYYGPAFGNSVEVIEGLGGHPGSYDHQDYFSNQLGYDFYSNYQSRIVTNPSYFAYYLSDYLNNVNLRTHNTDPAAINKRCP